MVEVVNITGKFNQVVVDAACGKNVPYARVNASNPNEIADATIIEQTQLVKTYFNTDGIIIGYSLTIRGYEALTTIKLNDNIERFRKSSDDTNFVLALLTFMLVGIGILQALNILFPAPIITSGVINANSLNAGRFILTTSNHTNITATNQIFTNLNVTGKLNGTFSSSSQGQAAGSVYNRVNTIYAFLGLFVIVGFVILIKLILPKISVVNNFYNWLLRKLSK